MNDHDELVMLKREFEALLKLIGVVRVVEKRYTGGSAEPFIDSRYLINVENHTTGVEYY